MRINLKIESLEDLNANLALLSNSYEFLDNSSVIYVHNCIYDYVIKILQNIHISNEHFCGILQNIYYDYGSCPKCWFRSQELANIMNCLAGEIKDRFCSDNYLYATSKTPEKYQPLTKRYVIELLLAIYYEEYD